MLASPFFPIESQGPVVGLLIIGSDSATNFVLQIVESQMTWSILSRKEYKIVELSLHV